MKNTNQPAKDQRCKLKVKTVLNDIQHFPGFGLRGYPAAAPAGGPAEPPWRLSFCRTRASRKARGVSSRRPAMTSLPPRSWLFVPLWGLVTWFIYAARRVQCPEHGWWWNMCLGAMASGPVTLAMMCFLSRWARRLSWRETARVFGTSWNVFIARWNGLWTGAWRAGSLVDVHALGVDEIHWGRSQRPDNFLTVIYQIDVHCRRLLWWATRRTEATLRRALAALGEKWSAVCSLCAATCGGRT